MLDATLDMDAETVAEQIEKIHMDFVFIPKPEYIQDYPAMVVELKWNQSAKTAMQQIKEKHYPDSLRSYAGEIFLWR